MSAATRLWRRAPLWRLALATTATFAVLASLYPAAWLGRVAAPVRRATGLPPATTPASRPTIVAAPDFNRDAGRVVPFAGHVLPLPPGHWHNLLVIRDDGPTEVDIAVLARVQDNRLAGLLLASGNVLPFPPALHPTLPFQCFDSRTPIAAPPDDASASGHDCWYAAPLPVDSVIEAAYARLHALGIATPATLGSAAWVEVRNGDIERIVVAVPGDDAGTLHREAAVMRSWRPLLRRGFDGALTARDVPSKPS